MTTDPDSELPAAAARAVYFTALSTLLRFDRAKGQQPDHHPRRCR